MNAFLVSLQVLLLAAALPLFVMSLRTSRRRASRHMGFLSLASLIAIGAVLLAMFSLGELASGAEADLALSFAPPLATIVLCGVIVGRAMGADRRGQGRGSNPARAA